MKRTIQSSDNAFLGQVAAVQDKIVVALPAIHFYIEQSEPENIRAARAIGMSAAN